MGIPCPGCSASGDGIIRTPSACSDASTPHDDCQSRSSSSRKQRRVTFAAVVTRDDEHRLQRCASECIGVPNSDVCRASELNWWLAEAVLDYSHFSRPRETAREMPQKYTFKSGILVKQGWWAKTWRRRLFVLEGALLRYYDPVERGWPKGTIPLAHVSDVFESGNELRVKTAKRTYRLIAPGGASNGWLRAIQQNMQVLRAAPITMGVSGTAQRALHSPAGLAV